MSLFGLVASLLGVAGQSNDVKAWWTSTPWLVFVGVVIVASFFIP